ncbi:MAG: hypothetical protein KDD53_05380, partial [Bdellovibrionales bacterium]|nr:hypothetical protein [Bdellovibrionales bacterium]
RPRIVSLSVVNEDEIGHEESGHDPVANEEEDEHASNSENDVFVVDLSPETTNFKSKQVKLRAKDEEQRIYILPLEPVLGNRQQYTARATLLPKEGDYVLSVIFSGIGKDKRRLTRESNELQYRYQVGESVPKVEVLTVAKEEVKVEKKKVSATAPIFLLSLLNLGVGATLVFMLKKEVAGITVTVEQYQAPESIITSVAQVRARAALKEIRFDDPLFSDDNIARIKDRKPLDLSNIDLSAAQALAESRGEIVPPSPVADAVEVEDSDPNEQIDSSEADDTQTGESESDEDGGDEADGSDSEGVDQEEETDSDSAEEEFEEDTQEEEEEEPDS